MYSFMPPPPPPPPGPPGYMEAPAAEPAEAPAPPAYEPTNPPSHTLYVNNLDEHIREPDLREELEMRFKPFGQVRGPAGTPHALTACLPAPRRFCKSRR